MPNTKPPILKTEIPNYSLWLGALGIVYGDIGTSPLYTVKECFAQGYLEHNAVNIFGIISLIIWALIIIVTIKYVVFVLRADNNGEGGVLSLGAIVMRNKRKFLNTKHNKLWLLLLVVAGTALFYGDGVITPAISVLGALEGLTILSPGLSPDTIVTLALITVAILFATQYWGTYYIGRLYGPILVVWFTVIAILGAIQIYKTPHILASFNPWYALQFFYIAPGKAMFSLAAVFLAVTGAEALYADLGHFTKKSIRQTWLFFVFPALCLNYMGQGALLLSSPTPIENPFYQLAPEWALMPLIILATISSVIASQAVISGIFSLSWQAMQLGYLPRMQVRHTSYHQRGHVYLPSVNAIFAVLTLLCVYMFRSSDNLASAYGVTVNTIMVITTILVCLLSHYEWRWPIYKTCLLIVPLLFIDLIFLSVNSLKIIEGGWFTLAISLVAFIIMRVWIKGRAIMLKHAKRTQAPLIEYFKKHKSELKGHRIPGAAIYMSNTPEIVSSAFLTNFRHNHCLHEKIIFLSIVVEEIPRVSSSQRILITEIQPSVYQISATYGFMDVPNIGKIFERLQDKGLDIHLSTTTFFVSRGIAVATSRVGLNKLEEAIYLFLSRMALNPGDYYKIPYNHFLELGVRFQI